MRHVVFLYAKEAVPQQVVLAAMRFRCAVAYVDKRRAAGITGAWVDPSVMS
jgi:hypothetical protein